MIFTKLIDIDCFLDDIEDTMVSLYDNEFTEMSFTVNYDTTVTYKYLNDVFLGVSLTFYRVSNRITNKLIGDFLERYYQGSNYEVCCHEDGVLDIHLEFQHEHENKRRRITMLVLYILMQHIRNGRAKNVRFIEGPKNDPEEKDTDVIVKDYPFENRLKRFKIIN
jgi:hypothetical protein